MLLLFINEDSRHINITRRKMYPTSTGGVYRFRYPTGGKHTSCLVETHRGKKIFLLMRYSILPEQQGEAQGITMNAIFRGGFFMEDRKLIKSKPHNVTIEGREKLTITGVKDVTSFDDNVVVLDTEAGGLTIKGSGLHINRLSVEDGNLFVEGYVISCVYSDKIDVKKTGSFLSNIFK